MAISPVFTPDKYTIALEESASVVRYNPILARIARQYSPILVLELTKKQEGQTRPRSTEYAPITTEELVMEIVCDVWTAFSKGQFDSSRGPFKKWAQATAERILTDRHRAANHRRRLNDRRTDRGAHEDKFADVFQPETSTTIPKRLVPLGSAANNERPVSAYLATQEYCRKNGLTLVEVFGAMMRDPKLAIMLGFRRPPAMNSLRNFERRVHKLGERQRRHRRTFLPPPPIPPQTPAPPPSYGSISAAAAG